MQKKELSHLLYALYFITLKEKIEDSQFFDLYWLMLVKNEERFYGENKHLDRGNVFGVKRVQAIYDEARYFTHNREFDFKTHPMMENLHFTNEEIYEYIEKVYEFMTENKEVLGIK